MEYYFSMEIIAPKGLEGIEDLIEECKMELKPRVSGFNGKTLLKTKEDANFEWSMDFYENDKIIASGCFIESLSEAEIKLESLSSVFKSMKLPHHILLDNETNYVHREFTFKWGKNT